MSRGGRLALVAATAPVVALALLAGGCARFDTRPVQVAPPAIAADCVVGTWKQTEGWQRLETEDLVTDLRLIAGGRQFTVNADGTGSVEYASPTTWQNISSTDKLEVLYAGTVTLTYTATDGEWNETADSSRSSTTLTLDGTTDAPRFGTAGRTTKATYRCSETDFIMTGDRFRQAFRRV